MKSLLVLAFTLTPWLHPEVEPAPPEFDHAPPYAVIVRHLPAGEVDAECRVFGGPVATMSGTHDACASMVGSICQVVLPWPGDVSAEKYAALARHELAHCNGWRHVYD